MYLFLLLPLIGIVLFVIVFTLAVKDYYKRHQPQTMGDRLDATVGLFCCQGYALYLLGAIMAFAFLAVIALNLGNVLVAQTVTLTLKTESLEPIPDPSGESTYYAVTCQGEYILNTQADYQRFGHAWNGHPLTVIEEDRSDAILITLLDQQVCPDNTARNWYCSDQPQNEDQVYYHLRLPPGTINRCLLETLILNQ